MDDRVMNRPQKPPTSPNPSPQTHKHTHARHTPLAHGRRRALLVTPAPAAAAAARTAHGCLLLLVRLRRLTTAAGVLRPFPSETELKRPRRWLPLTATRPRALLCFFAVVGVDCWL